MKPMFTSVYFRLLPFTSVYFRLLPALVFIIHLPCLIQTQSLFTEFHPDSIEMTLGQAARFTALNDSAINKSVRVVRTAAFHNGLESDTIAFHLPGHPDTLLAEATMAADDSVAGYLWAGRLLNELGYISLVNRVGHVGGFIQAGSRFYELVPLDTVYQFLTERNNDEPAGCDMSGTEPPDTLGGPSTPSECIYPSGIDSFNTCPAVVSVLLVLSQAGKDWILTNYGSIETYIAICQISVNLAFHNSNIPNKAIRIKWIERLDVDTSLSTFITDDLLNLPTIIGADREQHNADIAVLVTNQGYAGVGGAVADIGPNTDKAFAIVEAPYAISQFIFAHELGHLLGCRHNWPYDAGDDPTDVCAHAKRWLNLPLSPEDGEFYEVDETWSTIVGIPMPYSELGFWFGEEPVIYNVNYVNARDYKILHFSNPDVLYGGEPTGRSEGFIANNARFIRNNACTAADFFPTQELSVTISRQAGHPCLESKTFTAEIQQPETGQQGQPPYTVLWYWSPKAFAAGEYGTYIGTGANITFDNFPGCPVFWLKCIVISNDGVTVNTIKKVVIGSQICCTASPGHGGHGKSVSTATQIIPGGKLFPNPVVNGMLILETGAFTKSNLYYSVFDVSGHALLSGRSNGEMGVRLQINVASLPPGLYLLRVEQPSGRRNNYKFIIAQK